MNVRRLVCAGSNTWNAKNNLTSLESGFFTPLSQSAKSGECVGSSRLDPTLVSLHLSERLTSVSRLVYIAPGGSGRKDGRSGSGSPDRRERDSHGSADLRVCAQ